MPSTCFVAAVPLSAQRGTIRARPTSRWHASSAWAAPRPRRRAADTSQPSQAQPRGLERARARRRPAWERSDRPVEGSPMAEERKEIEDHEENHDDDNDDDDDEGGLHDDVGFSVFDTVYERYAEMQVSPGFFYDPEEGAYEVLDEQGNVVVRGATDWEATEDMRWLEVIEDLGKSGGGGDDAEEEDDDDQWLEAWMAKVNLQEEEDGGSGDAQVYLVEPAPTVTLGTASSSSSPALKRADDEAEILRRWQAEENFEVDEEEDDDFDEDDVDINLLKEVERDCDGSIGQSWILSLQNDG